MEANEKKPFPAWGLSLIILIAAYILMRYVGGLPGPLVNFFMLFIFAGSVIHITLKKGDIQETKRFISFVFSKGDSHKGAPVSSVLAGLRLVILVLIPLIAAITVYGKVAVSKTPPAALFTPHPTPPQWVVTLKVPDWAATIEKWDPKAIEEGGKIYEANCLPCHGKDADGKGPNAAAIKYPTSPTNFKEAGTIAQLPLSYVFWRVKDGGIFDPQFKSAMPGWNNELTEDEMWKVIMYVYSKAGVKPRTWE